MKKDVHELKKKNKSLDQLFVVAKIVYCELNFFIKMFNINS